MRYTLGLFLFFVTSVPVVGQIPGAVQIGQNVSKEELDKAIKVVNAAKASDFTWKVGQFQIFQKGDKAKGKLYWDVSDETILTVEEVPSSTQFWYDGFRADTAAAQRWKFPPQAESYWVFTAMKEGTTRISIFGVSADGKEVVLVAKMSVTVGTPPKPPEPTPPKPPAPIPDAGLRVLMVYESGESNTLSSAQVGAMNAKEVREWLNANTVKVNGQPEWHLWDKDTNISKESDVWKRMMALPRKSTPWIIISDGKTGYEGPFPPDKDELMKLLKRYGGN